MILSSRIKRSRLTRFPAVGGQPKPKWAGGARPEKRNPGETLRDRIHSGGCDLRIRDQSLVLITMSANWRSSAEPVPALADARCLGEDYGGNASATLRHLEEFSVGEFGPSPFEPGATWMADQPVTARGFRACGLRSNSLRR